MQKKVKDLLLYKLSLERIAKVLKEELAFYNTVSKNNQHNRK